MFQTIKQAEGNLGSFVRLIKLESDDYAVIVRVASDGRLHQRYIGPDLSKAEETFSSEIARLETADREA
jgi:hypothetical protein